VRPLDLLDQAVTAQDAEEVADFRAPLFTFTGVGRRVGEEQRQNVRGNTLFDGRVSTFGEGFAAGSWRALL